MGARESGKWKPYEATSAMKPLRFRPYAPALLLTLSLFLLAACGSPFTEAPQVADSTFVSALAELHLAQARLRLAARADGPPPPPPDTTRAPLPPGVRDSILARHGLRYRQFRAALEYYVRHPEQYQDLYVRVVDTLSAEQEALRLDGDRPGTPPSERPTPEAFRQHESQK